MGKENKRLILTIVLSGVATFLGYLINFFLTPYITDLVGIDAYGFVSIAKTAVSYASIITVALTTFIVRFVSVDYLKKDYKSANLYYTSSIIACFVLSVAIFLVACFIIIGLENLLNIPDELVKSVKLLFLLTFLNFVFSTVSTPYSSSFFIKNRLDYSNIIRIVAYIFDAGTLVVLFKIFDADIWFVGVGSLVSSVIILIGNVILTKVLTPELRFDKKNFSFGRVKQIVSNGIWQSINSLGNVLNSGLDLIVSNQFLSGVQTGQIAVVKTIGGMFSTLYTVISQPFQPKLLRAYSTGNMAQFIDELKKAMRVCGGLSNIAFAGFFALGGLYYRLWLPTQDYRLLYILTLITVFQSITEGYAYPIYYIYTLTLKKKIPCFMTILSGLLNVVSMVILLQSTQMGAYAIVVTTAVIMTGMNLVFNPMYSMRCLGIKTTMLFPTILRHILSAIVMSVLFHLIAYAINPSNWIGLIVSAVVMVVVGVVTHFLIMSNKHDYIKLINRFK